MINVDISNKRIINERCSVAFDELVRLLNLHESDIAYLGGSLVEGTVDNLSNGMGNKHSDIDIYIIREHELYIESSCVYDDGVKKTYFIDNIFNGIDVEIYDAMYIEKVLNVLSESCADPHVRSHNALSVKIEQGGGISMINSFLNRLVHSVCIQNETEYDRIKRDINYDNFLEVRANSLISIIDNMYYDVEGNVDGGQYDVALFCLRNLFIKVLMYVLCKEGIFVDREKWVPLKFRNFVEKNQKYDRLWDSYHMVFYTDLTSETVCSKAIRDAIRTTKNELENMQLEGISL